MMPAVEPEPVPPAPVEVVPYDPHWPALFDAESRKVRDALGAFVDGGTLEELEHIGSTSVPSLCAKPTVDMLGRIHPYPPSQESIAALAVEGYTWRGEYGLPGRTYFTKGPHDYHLHLVGFDGDLWERHLLFRDYLRAHPLARERYATLKLDLAELFHYDRPAYQDGKTALVTELSREARAWHLQSTGFAPVETLVSWLDGLPDDGLWLVSSGWALDLHLGAPSRYHDDVDVEIDRDGQALVQHHLLTTGWRLDQVVDHGHYAPWPAGEPLAPDSHQVHGRRKAAFDEPSHRSSPVASGGASGGASSGQSSGVSSGQSSGQLSGPSGSEFLDLLFAERGPGIWRFRRDQRVTLPLATAVRTATLPSGRTVTYLCPEAVLLFKSRSSQAGSEAAPRAKDAADFARVLPELRAEAREWLAAALRTVHGEHPWLEVLTAG